MFRIISYMLICTILPKRFVLCVVSKSPVQNLPIKAMPSAAIPDKAPCSHDFEHLLKV